MKVTLKLISVFISFGHLLACYGEVGAADPETVSGAKLKSGIEYKAEGLADPFIDFKTEKKKEDTHKTEKLKPLPSLVVQGMIWGGNLPQAIINNKVLTIGDAIEGVKIKSIDKEGISVLFEGQLYKIASPAETNYGNLKNIQEGGKK
ncbi:MAG: hypothetical protein WC469_03805 [Candidatus Omnitrophota bacterium]|jgi:type II secretory pathway component PulC